MATIADSFVAWALTKSAVTGLLNSATDGIMTDKAGLTINRPFVRAELTSHPIDYHAGGQILLGDARITLHCEGDTLTTARNIAEQFRLLFINVRQVTMGSIVIKAGFLDNIRDRSSNIVSGKEEGLPAVLCDLRLRYVMPAS